MMASNESGLLAMKSNMSLLKTRFLTEELSQAMEQVAVDFLFGRRVQDSQLNEATFPLGEVELSCLNMAMTDFLHNLESDCLRFGRSSNDLEQGPRSQRIGSSLV
jgi:hypothetical protein